jgi:hypothetical protein
MDRNFFHGSKIPFHIGTWRLANQATKIPSQTSPASPQTSLSTIWRLSENRYPSSRCPKFTYPQRFRQCFCMSLYHYSRHGNLSCSPTYEPRSDNLIALVISSFRYFPLIEQSDLLQISHWFLISEVFGVNLCHILMLCTPWIIFPFTFHLKTVKAYFL